MVCLESLCKVLGVLRKMISNGSWGSRKVGKSKVITRLDFCHWKTDSRANSLLTKLCWKGRDRGEVQFYSILFYLKNCEICICEFHPRMNAVGESGGWLRRHSGRQKASPGRKKQTQLQEGQESQKIKVPNIHVWNLKIFWWGPNDLLNKDFDKGDGNINLRGGFQSDGEYLVGRGW